MPLARRERADDHVDPAVGPHGDLGALAGRAGVQLEVVRQPDAAVAAAAARLGAARLESLPVGQRHHPVQRGGVVAAVVEQAHGIAVGHRARRHEIAPPELHAVEAVAARGQVDQPLDDVHHLGAPGAAIRVRRRRVAEHRPRAHVRGGEVIEARQHADALAERDERDGVRADVARVHAAKSEEVAVGVEGQLQVRDEITRVKVGEQRLAALARPFDRATDAPGGPRHQRELRIERVAGAVVAADLARNDADGAARHAQRFRQVVLDALAAARAGIERVMIALRVVHGERRARLQRDAGDAVHAGLEPDHVGGAGERGVGGGRIAAVGVDAHVGAGLLPDERRAGGGRLRGADHDRQRLVLHPHRLGAVAGGRRRLGDDHGHRLAHEPHAVGGQRRVRGDKVLRAVAVRELRLVRVGRNGAVRNRLEPVGGHVGAGQHGDHARHLERAGHIDTDDARVRMR